MHKLWKAEMTEAAEKFNFFNKSHLIKWEGLSDGGKRTRAIEFAEAYNKAISKDRDYYKEQLEKLRSVVKEYEALLSKNY